MRPDQIPDELPVVGVRDAAARSWSEHEMFRIGAALTGCLTMAVFLWAVVNLPVRGAVAGFEMPGGKAPSASQTAPISSAAAASAKPAVFATALPTVAPTAVPTELPAPAPTVASRPAAAPPASPTAHASAPKAAAGSYTVQTGDTLFSIARRHGVTVQTLATLNGISDSGVLKAGEQLKVP